MIPDLGKYADTVLSAYAVSLLLIVAILLLSLRRSRSVKAELDKIEAQERASPKASP